MGPDTFRLSGEREGGRLLVLINSRGVGDTTMANSAITGMNTFTKEDGVDTFRLSEDWGGGVNNLGL